MFDTTLTTRVYTPEQAADILQLSQNTVYQLIKQGEIIAKKIGKVYRIPATALSFVFTGLDYDLWLAQKEDLKYIKNVEEELSKVRAKL